MYKTFIDSIRPNSFDNSFVEPLCPLNKKHKVYSKKYRYSYFKETGSSFYQAQYHCVDCGKYYGVVDSSYMKYCPTPRYLVFKIIMHDDTIPAKIIAKEYDLSVNTIYRYKRKFKQEAIMIKECLKDNKITTFNQLKKFYQSNKLEAYENIKGIKMPKIENYK